MSQTPSAYVSFRRWVRHLGAMALAWCLGVAPAQAQPERLPAPLTSSTTLSLGDCLAIALERQPALAGHRASVSAAEAQKRGLDELHLARLISRELPIRRKQAALGITIAEAGLDQAEQETVYAV